MRHKSSSLAKSESSSGIFPSLQTVYAFLLTALHSLLHDPVQSSRVELTTIRKTIGDSRRQPCFTCQPVFTSNASLSCFPLSITWYASSSYSIQLVLTGVDKGFWH
ncbi:unnamed protein product [Heterobilharzia americana]|nr:unnamed protein product [Heterobilharzia americana]